MFDIYKCSCEQIQGKDGIFFLELVRASNGFQRKTPDGTWRQKDKQMPYEGAVKRLQKASFLFKDERNITQGEYSMVEYRFLPYEDPNSNKKEIALKKKVHFFYFANSVFIFQLFLFINICFYMSYRCIHMQLLSLHQHREWKKKVSLLLLNVFPVFQSLVLCPSHQSLVPCSRVWSCVLDKGVDALYTSSCSSVFYHFNKCLWICNLLTSQKPQTRARHMFCFSKLSVCAPPSVHRIWCFLVSNPL